MVLTDLQRQETVNGPWRARPWMRRMWVRWPDVMGDMDRMVDNDESVGLCRLQGDSRCRKQDGQGYEEGFGFAHGL